MLTECLIHACAGTFLVRIMFTPKSPMIGIGGSKLHKHDSRMYITTLNLYIMFNLNVND